MKRLLTAVLVLTFTLAIVFVSRPTQAQDEMMTHVCDSTLIALLYIAEHDYGFHSMMDVSTFEKGQFAPLFDEMMSMMDDGDMMATEEAMMDDGDMMATEESMMGTEEAMMNDMVVLTPGHIEGEDEACTALRTELDSFILEALKSDMSMMESGS